VRASPRQHVQHAFGAGFTRGARSVPRAHDEVPPQILERPSDETEPLPVDDVQVVPVQQDVARREVPVDRDRLHFEIRSRRDLADRVLREVAKRVVIRGLHQPAQPLLEIDSPERTARRGALKGEEPIEGARLVHRAPPELVQHLTRDEVLEHERRFLAEVVAPRSLPANELRAPHQRLVRARLFGDRLLRSAGSTQFDDATRPRAPRLEKVVRHAAPCVVVRLDEHGLKTLYLPALFGKETLDARDELGLRRCFGTRRHPGGAQATPAGEHQEVRHDPAVGVGPSEHVQPDRLDGLADVAHPSRPHELEKHPRVLQPPAVEWRQEVGAHPVKRHVGHPLARQELPNPVGRKLNPGAVSAAEPRQRPRESIREAPVEPSPIIEKPGGLPHSRPCGRLRVLTTHRHGRCPNAVFDRHEIGATVGKRSELRLGRNDPHVRKRSLRPHAALPLEGVG
jgi:hypothetical protein